ncbi:MAG: ferrous iron transport protein B [Desulfobulbaceae bacterium]|jgi:ferrous iron transport protein B|nr:ferrous iron transport protein B [Desulfobulbaceae bacterium]
MPESTITMALAGNPNAGKTTLFNDLTGARQHVGNYPGVTVDYKTGSLRHQGKEIVITDLPGTYSMTAYSAEELVARDYLIRERPAVVINIVDASNLERNLYLTCQLLELGIPIVIALNMMDVAKDRGIEIAVEKLARLIETPVVPVVARSGVGVKDLLDAAVALAAEHHAWRPRVISYGEDVDAALAEMSAAIEKRGFLTDSYPPRYTAVKLLENDEQLANLSAATDPNFTRELIERMEKLSEHTQKTLDVYPEAVIADHRYGYIKSIIRQGVITRAYDSSRLYASDKIDKVLTHRLLGPLMMLAILYALYTFTFSWSEYPVAWLEAGIGAISDMVSARLPDGLIKSLVVSGIIEGVGGVFGFVPLIMFMFFGIAILEDSGYLARVAFMMDRVFRIFGLHGSSVMPFIVSGGIAGGCAVPGVMATRTLRSPKERLATLLTVPFMNCGAKVPVLALLIGAFFSEHQARNMFLFTMLAWIMALITAKLLRLTVLRGEPTPFVMELPPYRFPTLRGLLIHTWERTWQYIKKAGTVILAISIVLWALMTFPKLDAASRDGFDRERDAAKVVFTQEIQDEAASEREDISETGQSLRDKLAAIDAREAEAGLEYSVAGRLGRGFEPISRWAGFDWRTNIALLGGVAAKEVIVSTLGTAYSMGDIDPDDSRSLASRLQADPGWNPVTAAAVLVFIMFYAPCFVTVVCIARESSWKWAAFSVCFNTVCAFLLAAAVFQIGAFLG